MNESSENPSTPNATVAAAQVVLARKSNERIPLSLGKASLRIRLEAYYSLIAPETLSNRTLWLRKYDQIYEKYGGSYRGERKLASKLAKKYGTAVRLLVVTEETIRKTNGPATEHPSGKRDESWYQLLPDQAGSGVLDFLSSKFDPSAVLTRASVSDVSRANPWMEGSSILDNIGKCVNLLPDDDPLYREDYLRRQLQKDIASKQSSATIQSLLAPQESSSKINDDQRTKKRPHSNPHPFDTISSQLHSGPHSFLFRMKEERKRVRIVVRYVNMVRGNLSGTLIAFDKHMNMILRDVEEVYSPRLVDEENNKSNLELELERRRRVNTSREEATLLDDSSSVFDKGGQHLSQQPGMWNVRKRQMKQLMVRGDMVVSIYEADKEDREIKKSRYYKQEATAKRE